MRPTRKEHDERVAVCADMLARGFRNGAIKRRVAAFYDISPRTVERYLRRARDRLVEELEEGGRDEHRARSLDQYRMLLRDDGTTPVIRLKAQERIDKILGLEAPAEVRQEVYGKVDLVTALNAPAVEALRATRERLN